jgi:hypothetical protein
VPLETSAIVEHTPGPWAYRVVDDGQSAGIRVYAPKTATDIVHMPKVRVRGQYNTEKEANARLIAAAPDLAEALVMLMHCGPQPCMGEWKRAIQNAAAAIDKAAGRE